MISFPRSLIVCSAFFLAIAIMYGTAFLHTPNSNRLSRMQVSTLLASWELYFMFSFLESFLLYELYFLVNVSFHSCLHNSYVYPSNLRTSYNAKHIPRFRWMISDLGDSRFLWIGRRKKSSNRNQNPRDCFLSMVQRKLLYRRRSRWLQNQLNPKWKKG